MDARIAPTVSKEWAELRAWSADVRDAANALIAVLDAQQDQRNPALAAELHKTSELLHKQLIAKLSPDRKAW